MIQLDRKAIERIALGESSEDISILKRYCSFKNESINGSWMEIGDEYCSFLFAKIPWPDWSVGLLLLILSIVILCLCLIFLVKILQSLLKGAVRNVIFKMVNSDFPGVFKYFTPYLAILVNIID